MKEVSPMASESSSAIADLIGLRRLLLLTRPGVGLAGEVDRHGPRILTVDGHQAAEHVGAVVPPLRVVVAHQLAGPGRRRWCGPASPGRSRPSRGPRGRPRRPAVLSWNAGSLVEERLQPADHHAPCSGRSLLRRAASSESNRARPMNQPVVGDSRGAAEPAVGRGPEVRHPAVEHVLHLCGIGDRSLEHLHEHRVSSCIGTPPERAPDATPRRGGPHPGPVQFAGRSFGRIAP